MQARHVAGSVMLAATLLLAAARGSADPAPFRVMYDAPPQCPTLDEFTTALEARASRARRAAPHELAHIVRVRIRQGDSGLSGTLRLVDVNGDATERTVTAPDCAALVAALSLAGALALESLTAEAPAQAEALWLLPALRWPDPWGPGASSWPAAAVQLVPIHSPEAPARRPASLAFMAMTLQDGWSPRWAPGVALGVEHDRPGGLRLRGTANAASAGRVNVSGERARFDWVAAGAQACVWADLGRSVRLAGCALSQLGAIRGRGVPSQHIAAARTAWRTWLTAGPAIEADFWIGRSTRLEAAAGLPFALLRPNFVFDAPRVPVHRAPLTGVWTSIGLATGLF
jgi:hypothetical protein